MFPLADEAPRGGRFPWITFSLIFVNVAFFLFTRDALDFFAENFGFVPARFFQGENSLSPITSLFLHGSFLHLLGNLWFLWIFGDNVEHYLGKIKFLLFYFLSGLGSAIFYSLLTVNQTLPVIGASGAISGILGAYLVLFPRHRVKTLVTFFTYWSLTSVPAFFFIGLWFFYQFLYAGVDPFVAYWGHIGGFLNGVLLINLYGKIKSRPTPAE